MTKRLALLSLLVAICLDLSGQQNDYADAPQVVKDVVNKGAQNIVDKKMTIAGAVADIWPEVVLYVTADAVLQPDLEEVSIRSLSAYTYLGETARTDKQTGASATSGGSTTLAEKPGIPLFLAYAIEHGAIEKAVSGNAMTLSGSLYGPLALGGDTADKFQRYSFWRRIGYSATFNLSENQPSSLAGLNLKQVSEFSFRARILGDRSTRSKEFIKMWKDQVQPEIKFRLDVITTGEADLVNKEEILWKAAQGLRTELVGEISERLATLTADSREERIAKIENLVLRALKTGLFDQIRDKKIPVSDSTKATLRSKTVPLLKKAHEDLEKTRARLDQLVEEFNKSRLLTLEYTNHRTPLGSDYSEFKLLYAQPVRLDPLRFDLIANAAVSTFHKPDPALNQTRIRDFSFTLSAEGNAKSPFRSAVTSDVSKVTYSFSGRYERMKETRQDIAVAQFKVELPISMGLSLPFSVTYANRTEYLNEKEVRGNFGFSLDLDKLYALTRKEGSR